MTLGFCWGCGGAGFDIFFPTISLNGGVNTTFDTDVKFTYYSQQVWRSSTRCTADSV